MQASKGEGVRTGEGGLRLASESLRAVLALHRHSSCSLLFVSSTLQGMMGALSGRAYQREKRAGSVTVMIPISAPAIPAAAGIVTRVSHDARSVT